MDKDLEKIEIRSKKVRDIMAEKPPFIISHSTTMIAIFLFIATIIIWLLY